MTNPDPRSRVEALMKIARDAFEAENKLWKREHDHDQNFEEFRKHGSKFNVWREGSGARTVYVDYDAAVKIATDASWRAAIEAVTLAIVNGS